MTNDDAFDLREFLPYLLNQAAEAAGQEFQTVYKSRYGMLRSEWRVVFHLGRYGDMTAREIVDRSATHKTKISRAVKALEDKRYLTRREVETDRRCETLSLTRTGRIVYDDLVEVARDFDHKVAMRLEPGESDMLRRALRKLGGLT